MSTPNAQLREADLALGSRQSAVHQDQPHAALLRRFSGSVDELQCRPRDPNTPHTGPAIGYGEHIGTRDAGGCEQCVEDRDRLIGRVPAADVESSSRRRCDGQARGEAYPSSSTR